MSSWGKGLGVLILLSFVILSCEDENHLLGFQAPDENYKMVYKEFTLPTSIFQIDSLATSNSGSGTNRVLAGTFNDPVFGNGTAISYLQYFPLSFPTISDKAILESTTMYLTSDLYMFGTDVTSFLTFEIHQLDDSLINSQSYYTTSLAAIAARPALATITHKVEPSTYNDGYKANFDNVSTNNVYDTLELDLDGPHFNSVFEAVRSTDSVAIATYQNFSRWRRIFKGLAVVPVGTDKLIGFDPTRSGITMKYKDGDTSGEIKLTLSPTNGMMTYTSIIIDRTGTPVSIISQPFTSYDPVDGRRYIQSGGSIVTKVDMTAVYDYFDDIPVKSVNVAELSIVADVQPTAPQSFFLRAVKPDNHPVLGLTTVLNEVYDSVVVADPVFISKHYVNPNSAPRADVVGDDGETLFLQTVEGKADYKGYMTNFLQKEISLADKDYLTHFSLIPASPEFAKSVNGFHFHKDSVRLRVYYTTPNLEE